MTSRLYVGNLDYNAQNQDLTDLFAQFGKVMSAEVLMDRDTGRARGFGFVEYSSSADASRAIDALNGQDFRGRSLTVNEAKERSGAPRGSDRNGGPRRNDRY